MLTRHQPEVGHWYQDLDAGYQFEVVAIDDVTGMIETQYFEGELEELEKESWYKMNLRPIELPEDWSGQFDYEDGNDLLTADDEYDSDLKVVEEPWFGPLNGVGDDQFDNEAEW